MQNPENSTKGKNQLTYSLELLQNAKDQEAGIRAVQEMKAKVHSMRRQLAIAEDAIWKLQSFFEENKDVKISGESMMEDARFSEKIDEAIEVLKGVFE